jgi:hypothetical protein
VEPFGSDRAFYELSCGFVVHTRMLFAKYFNIVTGTK